MIPSKLFEPYKNIHSFLIKNKTDLWLFVSDNGMIDHSDQSSPRNQLVNEDKIYILNFLRSIEYMTEEGITRQKKVEK